MTWIVGEFSIQKHRVSVCIKSGLVPTQLSAVFCRLSMFLPVKDKVAPSLEKRIAVAAPMPLEAPVIKATLPENFDPTCEAIAGKMKDSRMKF